MKVRFALLLIPASSMDVIQINEDKGDATKNTVIQALECLSAQRAGVGTPRA